jgi:hypothetical protein
MPMTPQDILEIQSAIDRYEKKFPRRPSPTPAVALAWKAGKRSDPGKESWIGIARMRSLLLVLWTRTGSLAHALVPVSNKRLGSNG